MNHSKSCRGEVVVVAGKRKLRWHLLERITLYLESQGFKRWKPAGLVPFACYERYRQRKRDLVDIQFDKCGRLAFFVNLASISGETVETMFEGVMPGSQVTTAHLHEGCRLQGGRMSSAFKASWLARLRGPEHSSEQVSKLFKSRFTEALDWFESGTAGTHIRMYRL